MQVTSLEAREKIRRKLGYRQMEVYKLLEHSVHALTNSEIAEELHRTINTITPRTNELVNKKGLVKEDCKRECLITSRTAIAWRIKRPDEIHERQGEFNYGR